MTVICRAFQLAAVTLGVLVAPLSATVGAQPVPQPPVLLSQEARDGKLARVSRTFERLSEEYESELAGSPTSGEAPPDGLSLQIQDALRALLEEQE